MPFMSIPSANSGSDRMAAARAPFAWTLALGPMDASGRPP